MAAILDLWTVLLNNKLVSKMRYDIYFKKWYYVSFSVKNIMYNIFLKIVVAAILDL